MKEACAVIGCLIAIASASCAAEPVPTVKPSLGTGLRLADAFGAFAEVCAAEEKAVGECGCDLTGSRAGDEAICEALLNVSRAISELDVEHGQPYGETPYPAFFGRMRDRLSTGDAGVRLHILHAIFAVCDDGHVMLDDAAVQCRFEVEEGCLQVLEKDEAEAVRSLAIEFLERGYLSSSGIDRLSRLASAQDSMSDNERRRARRLLDEFADREGGSD